MDTCIQHNPSVVFLLETKKKRDSSLDEMKAMLSTSFGYQCNRFVLSYSCDVEG